MSDNVASVNDFTGCPYCCGSYSTAGFIHTLDCPNRPESYYYRSTSIDVVDKSEYDKAQAEISRLKAALEKAERERDEAYELCKTQSDNLDRRDMDIFDLNRFYFELSKDRDEARRWAKYYRWLFIGMLPPEKDEAENG